MTIEEQNHLLYEKIFSVPPESDELYHHGVKGMKWYQHLFGKDESSGGSRKKGESSDGGSKDNEKITKKSGGKSASSSNNPIESYKGLSIEELRRRTQQMTDIKNYLDAERNLKEASRNKFSRTIINDVLKPAFIEVGKKQIAKYLNKAIFEFGNIYS